jgi:hypothetical protein
MSTRTIVTSQPDVACDVCERRLLRGEQPDVFIAAGQRLTVCELSAPRAAHEGWIRESEASAVVLPPARARRGRSLLDRLRQVGRPPARERAQEHGTAAGPSPAEAQFAPGAALAAGVPAAAGPLDWAAGAPDGSELAAPLAPASFEEQAVAVFNASEFPRRVAGVARSLGSPHVSVRSAEHLASVVRIVVAWELSWYRYEVDLSEGGGEARVLAQGSELSELSGEERRANALADDAGQLTLAE